MAHHRQHYHRRDCGFTLVEIIVAITIFAVMMGITYALLFKMLQMSKSLDDRRDLQLLQSVVLNRITSELQRADVSTSLIPPESQVGSFTGKTIYFQGTKEGGRRSGRADSITFIATDGGQYVPDGGTHTGKVQISYKVLPDPERPGSLVLVREELPKVSPATKAYQNKMVFPITKNIVNLSFRYFEITTEQWMDEWGENNRDPIPRLIEITITLRSAKGLEHTSSTVVAPSAMISRTI